MITLDSYNKPANATALANELRKIAANIEAHGELWEGHGESIRDGNGNHVGEWDIQ